MQADAFAAGFVLGEGSVGTDEASLERFCEILAILGYEVPASQKREMLAYATKVAEAVNA